METYFIAFGFGPDGELYDWVQYRYRTDDGQVFAVRCVTLPQARRERDAWLAFRAELLEGGR